MKEGRVNVKREGGRVNVKGESGWKSGGKFTLVTRCWITLTKGREGELSFYLF